MMRLLTLIIMCSLPILVAGEEDSRVRRALETFDLAAQKAQEEYREVVAKATERRDKEVEGARKKVITGLKRLLSSRADAATTTVVYRKVLSFDRQDPEARGFFETLGILDKVLADIQPRAKRGNSVEGPVEEPQEVGPPPAELTVRLDLFFIDSKSPDRLIPGGRIGQTGSGPQDIGEQTVLALLGKPLSPEVLRNIDKYSIELLFHQTNSLINVDEFSIFPLLGDLDQSAVSFQSKPDMGQEALHTGGFHKGNNTVKTKGFANALREALGTGDVFVGLAFVATQTHWRKNRTDTISSASIIFRKVDG